MFFPFGKNLEETFFYEKSLYDFDFQQAYDYFLSAKKNEAVRKGTKKKQKKNCNYWLSPSYSVVLAFIYRLYTKNNYNICFK